MHGLFPHANELSGLVIAAAIEVHRTLGPGLLERIYERCLIHELELRRIPVVSQRTVQIRYKDIVFEEELRFDLLVDGCLLIEVKAVQEVVPVHKAQLLSYLKLLDVPHLRLHSPPWQSSRSGRQDEQDQQDETKASCQSCPISLSLSVLLILDLCVRCANFRRGLRLADPPLTGSATPASQPWLCD